MAEDAAPKRREDDCEMATTYQQETMTKLELLLFEASRTGQVELIGPILESKKVDINVRNNLGRTPLIMAAANGHLDAVTTLCENRAQVEAFDKLGMSALFWAAQKNHPDVAKYLLTRDSHINRKTKQGFSLVHICARNCLLDLLRDAMKKVRNLNIDTQDDQGITPFLMAIMEGHVEMMEFFGVHRVNVLVVDSIGRTCLHHGAISGHIVPMKFLLSIPNIKELLQMIDKTGKSALHYALEKGNYAIVKELLHNGFDPNFSGIAWALPIVECAKLGRTDIMQLLLDYGADLSLTNMSQNTALHMTVYFGTRDAIVLLLRYGSNLEARNKRLQTALHIAAEQNKVDATDVLLMAGAALDVVDKTGKTPLMIAARGGYTTIVDMIIKADRMRTRIPEMATKLRAFYGKKVLHVHYVNPKDKKAAEEDLEFIDSEGSTDREISSEEDNFFSIFKKKRRRKRKKKEDAKVNKQPENEENGALVESSSESSNHEKAEKLDNDLDEESEVDSVEQFSDDLEEGQDEDEDEQEKDQSIHKQDENRSEVQSTFFGTIAALFREPSPVLVLPKKSPKSKPKKPLLIGLKSLKGSKKSKKTSDEDSELADDEGYAKNKDEQLTDSETAKPQQRKSLVTEENEMKLVVDDDGNISVVDSQYDRKPDEVVKGKPTTSGKKLKLFQNRMNFFSKKNKNDNSDSETVSTQHQTLRSYDVTTLRDSDYEESILPNDCSVIEIQDKAVERNINEIIDHLVPELTLQKSYRVYAQNLENYMFYLTHKLIKSEDLRKLAYFWEFKAEHLAAIECEDPKGKKAYATHGFRVMVIWFHGLRIEEEVSEQLNYALISIGQKKLAREIRRDLNKVRNKYLQ